MSGWASPSPKWDNTIAVEDEISFAETVEANDAFWMTTACLQREVEPCFSNIV